FCIHLTCMGMKFIYATKPLSIVSAWLMVSFFTALKTSVWQTKQMASKYEQLLFKAYRYVPMVFLSSLVAYLSLQLSIAF
ncbi:hypothetical protein HWV63_14570, partial [Acinetobacter baumannii]|nr:hypothetical protein [Acinetobacter baumannii]